MKRLVPTLVAALLACTASAQMIVKRGPIAVASGGTTVTYQNSASASLNGGTTNTLSISGFTSGSDSNRVLYLAVCSSSSPPLSGLGCTAGGNAMTEITTARQAASGGWNGVQWFYYVAPSTSAYTIACSWTPTFPDVAIGAIALNGVNTSTVFQNVASNNTVTADALSDTITSAAGNYTLSAASYGNNNVLGSSLQTQRWNVSGLTANGLACAGSSAAGATTVTHGWTANGTDVGAISGFDVPHN